MAKVAASMHGLAIQMASIAWARYHNHTYTGRPVWIVMFTRSIVFERQNSVLTRLKIKNGERSQKIVSESGSLKAERKG